MVDKKGPIDPSAQFQEFVSDWERGMDKFFNQMMGTINERNAKTAT